MSILDRGTLEESPLADLHAIASELSIDGYRRLRRSELIDAILSRQGGGEGPSEPQTDEPPLAEEELTGAVADELRARDDERPGRARRGRRGGRGRTAGSRDQSDAGGQAVEESEEGPTREPEEQAVEGVIELLPNGSGFVRVDPPEPSEDDIYVSAAQVKRCELISGDRVSGPRRPPRRSERFASLTRIETINGRPAAEVADSARFDDLPARFPSDHLRLGSDDATVKAIESQTPFGRGSRVTIVGPPVSGKTEALRRLAAALGAEESVQLSLVLVGIRPEELSDWGEGPIDPAGAVSFAASADVQGQTVERVIDQGRRLATRGVDAVVLIDTLDGLHAQAARKALAAARNLLDGGSLTVIATAAAPLGGETTVIALDPLLARTGRFPALDLRASWTMRPEVLVGENGAEEIARARVQVLEDQLLQ